MAGARREDFAAGPHDTVLHALEKATRNTLGRLAVLDQERFVGYLSLTDILHVLALRGIPTAEVAVLGRWQTGSPGPARRAA